MQQILAKKALYQPNHRFNDLYGLMRDSLWLRSPLEAILEHEGAQPPGIDEVTAEHLESEEARTQLIAKVVQELRDGATGQVRVYRYTLCQGM